MAEHFDNRRGEWLFKIGAGLVATWLITHVLSIPTISSDVDRLKEKAMAPRFSRDDGDTLREELHDFRMETCVRMARLETLAGMEPHRKDK